MLHLFLDTNTYLSFYSFTDDDLEELRKLRAAIKSDEVRLYITAQVRDELLRNRETKISEALGKFMDSSVGAKAPAVVRNLSDFPAFAEAQRTMGELRNKLNSELREQASEHRLAADTVIDELLEEAEDIDVDQTVLERARRRSDVGSPPGKRGSMGDAINWECLLATCPEEDLHLVSGDSDFASKLDKERVSEYLLDEWSRKSDGKLVTLYPRLSTFLREHFPHIRFASEFEKQRRIRALVESPSFLDTHRAIAALSAYDDFTDDQAKALAEAVAWNSQVNWIGRDRDIQDFYRELFDAHAEALAAEEFDEARRELGWPVEDRTAPTELDDVPF